MGPTDTTATVPEQSSTPRLGGGGGGVSPPSGGGSGPVPRPQGPRRFTKYKPEQGRTTRIGTLVGVGALIAWGGIFINNRLTGYQDVEEWWGLLITPGIPILFAIVFGTVAWWLTFSNQACSEFMIGTEGEMKKVNWSSRREIIGSTKVVILFTLMLAAFLFLFDIVFKFLFSWIGVLKT